jgi:hypothetical protein
MILADDFVQDLRAQPVGERARRGIGEPRRLE